MCDVYNCFAIRVLPRVRYLARTPFIFTVSLIRKKFVARRWNLLVKRRRRGGECHREGFLERVQEAFNLPGIAKYQDMGRRGVLRDRLKEAWQIFSAIRQEPMPEVPALPR